MNGPHAPCEIRSKYVLLACSKYLSRGPRGVLHRAAQLDNQDASEERREVRGNSMTHILTGLSTWPLGGRRCIGARAQAWGCGQGPPGGEGPRVYILEQHLLHNSDRLRYSTDLVESFVVSRAHAFAGAHARYGRRCANTALPPCCPSTNDAAEGAAVVERLSACN